MQVFLKWLATYSTILHNVWRKIRCWTWDNMVINSPDKYQAAQQMTNRFYGSRLINVECPKGTQCNMYSCVINKGQCNAKARCISYSWSRELDMLDYIYMYVGQFSKPWVFNRAGLTVNLVRYDVIKWLYLERCLVVTFPLFHSEVEWSCPLRYLCATERTLT